MSRTTGPRLKRMRSLGTDLPGLSRKSISAKPYPPGEQGTRRRSKDSEYKKQLQEKQKLRFNYGVHERHLRKLMAEARQSKESTGDRLVQLLESRLDSVVFRAGFAATIPAARQLVNHGHMLVNKKKVDVASYRVRVGDVIEPAAKTRDNKHVTDSWKHPVHERPAWIVADTGQMTARVESLPTIDTVLFPLDINQVLEFYAKRM